MYVYLEYFQIILFQIKYKVRECSFINPSNAELGQKLYEAAFDILKAT